MAQKNVTAFLMCFSELKEKLNECLCNSNINLEIASELLQKLSRLISQNATNIPGYELRRAGEEVELFKSRILKSQEALQEGGNFKFRRKKINESRPLPMLTENRETEISSHQSLKQPEQLVNSDINLSNLKEETITLNSESTSNKVVLLDNLERCTVIIQGVPNALRVTNLSGSTVIGGPIVTSLFVEKCCLSTFVFASKQVRIHSTLQCNFYLHVCSRIIIEDSSGCGFAPYNRFLKKTFLIHYYNIIF